MQLALVQGVEFGGGLFATGGNIDAKQRWAGDVDVPGIDQLGEVAEEQGEQQHLDVGPVHVGIAQDADFAVAQAGQIGAVVRAVGINANGHRDVMHFIVFK